MSHSENVLRNVKRRLLISYPFFGSAVSDLQFVPSEKVERLFASGPSILYNSDFVSASTPAETAYWLCREILHLTMDHGNRKRGRDSIIWAMATEYSVNDILTEAGLTKAVQVRFFKREFRGRSAEEIYSTLVREYRESGLLGEIEEISEEMNERIIDKTEQSLYLSIGKISRKLELNFDWLMELFLEEEKRAKQYGLYKPKVLEIISKARLAERTMGKSPFTVDLPIQKEEPSALPWEELLLGYVLNDRSQVSYRRFNRKYVSQNIFLPQRYQRYNSIVVAVDVSASISEASLNSFMSDIIYLAQTRTEDIRIRLIQVDAEIQFDMVIDHRSPLEQILHRKGFGGTDFRMLFNMLRKENNTDPVIIFTDGRAMVPDDPPEGYDVIWISTDLHIPWGINIDYRVM